MSEVEICIIFMINTIIFNIGERKIVNSRMSQFLCTMPPPTPNQSLTFFSPPSQKYESETLTLNLIGTKILLGHQAGSKLWGDCICIMTQTAISNFATG